VTALVCHTPWASSRRWCSTKVVINVISKNEGSSCHFPYNGCIVSGFMEEVSKLEGNYPESHGPIVFFLNLKF
ncbi:unnamed protein product, partial [Allacma fusca]